MSDFASAKAFLQQDSGGSNLYDHISELVLKLVAEQPADSLDLFEHLSSVVRQKTFTAGPGAGDSTDGLAAEQVNKIQKDYVDTCVQLFTTAEDDPEIDTSVAPSVLAALPALAKAGVAIGEDEAVLLDQAMARLVAADEGISEVRFWGKILGTKGDYYVLVAGPNTSEIEPTKSIEGVDAGPNSVVFYASNTIGMPESFTRLPDVSAADVKMVLDGNLRRFFTGDLTAQVGGHPSFGSNEAAFLRATLAVIDSKTMLVPSGAYEADADNNLLATDAEEFEPSGEPLDLSAAVLFRAGLNANGRAESFQEVDADGEPVGDALEQEGCLRALDEESFTAADGVIKSLTYPGFTAVSIDGNQTITNIYIGYGVPEKSTSHTPLFPMSIPTEYNDADIVEQKDNYDAPPEPEAEEEDAENED